MRMLVSMVVLHDEMMVFVMRQAQFITSGISIEVPDCLANRAGGYCGNLIFFSV
jgi:hypothetical protein